MADNSKPELRSLFSHADFGADSDTTVTATTRAATDSRGAKSTVASPAGESDAFSAPIAEPSSGSSKLPALVERWIAAREELAGWRARAEERAELVRELRHQVERWRGDMVAALNRAEREYARRVELEQRLAQLEAPTDTESVDVASELGDSVRGADLQGVDFCGADLRGARFDGADMRGASFRRTDLRDSDLRDADISRAKVKRLRKRKTGL